jgi:predicted nuclease of predicted toxin-antitoxin system
MRFLIDMPLSAALATWLKQQGHDALHAADLGLASAPDAAILERARHEGRVAVTADLDYPRLLALTGARGPGLILFRGGDYSERECIERLAQVFQKVSSQELENSIVVIERRRIRLRRLPPGPHR